MTFKLTRGQLHAVVRLRRPMTLAFALLLAIAGSTLAQQSGSVTIDLSGQCTATTETIVSATLVEGRLEIVKRSSCYPNSVPAIACLPKPCDWTIRKVWREVYAAQDGKIILLKKIEGKIIAAQEERIEWPE